jgi:hypothetical protein
VLAQEELDRHRLRELRRSSPTAVVGVERTLETDQRRIEHPGGRRPGRDRTVAGGRLALDCVGNAGPRLLDLLPLVVPCMDHAVEHLPERRHPVAWLVGEVRAAIERLAFRRQEDAHRPAALTRHRLHGVHVDRVEVGSLLAVHLDRHEAVVEHRGGGLVLEGLALHDVAPVTRGVADREKDRLVLGLRARERLLTPRIPVHRVVRVLEEVRTGLCRQSVLPRCLDPGTHGRMLHAESRAVRRAVY